MVNTYVMRLMMIFAALNVRGFFLIGLQNRNQLFPAHLLLNCQQLMNVIMFEKVMINLKLVLYLVTKLNC